MNLKQKIMGSVAGSALMGLALLAATANGKPTKEIKTQEPTPIVQKYTTHTVDTDNNGMPDYTLVLSGKELIAELYADQAGALETYCHKVAGKYTCEYLIR